MKNYDKTDIINRLKRNGLKPIYNKKTHQLMYFKKPKSRSVGIKLLGYLDFLGVKAI